MPQIYAARPEPPRRTVSSASSSSLSSASTISPRLIDADDSIVLSDLVRTGEASRLRRRGAMRLDHTSYNNSLGQNVQTRNIVVVDRPNWDSDYEYDFELSESHLGSTGRSSSMRYTRRHQPPRRYGPYGTATSPSEEQSDNTVYTLVCGVESYGTYDMEPFKPSVLPLYPPPPEDDEQMSSKRSTGCGSIVHWKASPRPRVGCWSACDPASSTVVPMDAEYFDTKEAGRRVRASCGCLKEGIGCAVCGNILGTRFVPCKVASESFNCAKHSDKTRLRGPEGPQYWQASTSQTSDHTIFSFFSDAVTSTPGYSFPPHKNDTRSSRLYSTSSEDFLNYSTYSPSTSRAPHHHPDPNASDDEDDDQTYHYGGEWHQSNYITQDENASTNLLQAPSNMILDRWVTASPTPMSETGDDLDISTNLMSEPPRQRTDSHSRRPIRSHTISGTTTNSIDITRTTSTLTAYDDSSGSFYQQQIIGAWEREHERERLENRAVTSVTDLGTHDQDSEDFVWGVETVVSGRVIPEPGSPDKVNERILLPEI